MDDPETAIERRARFLRLAAHLNDQLRQGKNPDQVREHLVIAIMIAPVSAAEGAALLADFDTAAAEAGE